MEQGGDKLQREGERVVYVKDKEGEIGIKLNNILTALILMVISWVGISINELKTGLSSLSKTQAVYELRISTIEKRLDKGGL